MNRQSVTYILYTPLPYVWKIDFGWDCWRNSFSANNDFEIESIIFIKKKRWITFFIRPKKKKKQITFCKGHIIDGLKCQSKNNLFFNFHCAVKSAISCLLSKTTCMKLIDNYIHMLELGICWGERWQIILIIWANLYLSKCLLIYQTDFL